MTGQLGQAALEHVVRGREKEVVNVLILTTLCMASTALVTRLRYKIAAQTTAQVRLIYKCFIIQNSNAKYFPFYEMYSDSVSFRRAKEHYFINLLKPLLN